MTRPSLDRFTGHRSERLPHGRWLPYRPKGVVRSNAWGLLLKFRSITGQGDGGMEDMICYGDSTQQKVTVGDLQNGVDGVSMREKPGLSDHSVMKTPHCYS